MAYIGNKPSDAILTTDQIADGTITASDLAASAISDKLGFAPQQALVSGTNIRTVNGSSLLSSGDLAVGTVTSASVASANGFAGTVATASSTPAITISTSVTGVLKGNGTAISAASAGTDYQIPLVSGTSIKTVNSTSLLGAGDVAVQPTLVSGTSIKTVNSNSILGAGNIAVQETLVSGTNIKTVGGTSLLGAGNIPVGTGTVTSVSLTTPSFLTVTGSPITSSGTLGISYSGFALPIANGGTSGTTAADARTGLELGTSNNVQHGSFGVGTAASGTTGEIRATNNVTAYYSSDRRLKENITEINNALDSVKKISGKTFDWTDDYIKAHGGIDGYFIRKQDFGVIAQDVQEVFPLAVRTRTDGTLAVDYEKLSALAFAAIKELALRLDRLEGKDGA